MSHVVPRQNRQRATGGRPIQAYDFLGCGAIMMRFDKLSEGLAMKKALILVVSMMLAGQVLADDVCTSRIEGQQRCVEGSHNFIHLEMCVVDDLSDTGFSWQSIDKFNYRRG